MITDSITAKANVDIGVTPQGSQQLVVMLLVLAGVALIMTGIFMWFDHKLWGWPAVMTASLVAAAVWRHSRSQQHLDRASAKPTTLTTPDGVSLQTDALTLADPDAAAMIERVISNAFHRRALPPPDGAACPGQQPDESVQARLAAQQRVAAVNQQAQQMRDNTVALLTGSGVANGELVTQERLSEPASMPDVVLTTTAPPEQLL